jgi:hypothetical protein
MNNLMNLIDGKKTYITTFIMALFNFLKAMGWIDIDQEQITSINALLGAAMVIFLRMGVKKSGNQ